MKQKTELSKYLFLFLVAATTCYFKVKIIAKHLFSIYYVLYEPHTLKNHCGIHSKHDRHYSSMPWTIFLKL